MPALRAAILLFVFVVATVAGIPWQASAVRFGLPRRKTFPHRYHSWLCRLFGIRITIVGKPIRDRGVLMAANHTSYFDIIVLSGAAPVSFVAKKEVGSWFFFGTLARLQETVFIERDRRSETTAARDAIRERLARGDALVLFPEGTSNDGNRVLPFRSALLAAAESEVATEPDGSPRYVPVQPVSVSYVGLQGIPMGRENRPFFAWYGDMDLVPHLWEAMKTGPFEVVVEFHPALSVDAVGGRKPLAAAAEAIVRAGQARALAGAYSDAPRTGLSPLPRRAARFGKAAASA
jgi:1-acyl-sn-glycerol-3-phosphate acyltransferase